MELAPRVFLALSFRVLAPITRLPVFPGAQWNAFFRYALGQALPSGTEIAKDDLQLEPVDMGLERLFPGERTRIGLSCPAHLAPAVLGRLRDFPAIRTEHGHFEANRTVFLEDILCRVSGHDLTAPANEPGPLTLAHLEPEAAVLGGLESYRIVLTTPLRMRHPHGQKAGRHSFCDEKLPAEDQEAFVRQLLNHCRMNLGLQPASAAPPRLSRADVMWLDPAPYGREQKRIGGLTGTLAFSGPLDHDTALSLVAAQYLGIGKNRTLGFGFLHIPELEGVHCVRSVGRGVNLLVRTFTADRLDAALEATLPLTPADVPQENRTRPEELSDPDIRAHLAAAVTGGRWRPGHVEARLIPKASGGFREIHLFGLVDKLVHRLLAEAIGPIIESFLGDSTFAYRTGRGRRDAADALRQALADGMTVGYKADVADFFPSVDTASPLGILAGILSGDPLLALLGALLSDFRSRGIRGLPQGSPLSPVLSNLTLAPFDASMATAGFTLLRYADDFLLLARDATGAEQAMAAARTRLEGLGFHLADDKTCRIEPGSPVRFLGCLVTPSEVVTEGEAEAVTPWTSCFHESWEGGTPVYLTPYTRSFLRKDELHVVRYDSPDSVERLPWSRISRLVIVGRAAVSGAVIHQAVRRGVPVTFLDILGRARGFLGSDLVPVPAMKQTQVRMIDDAAACLSLARGLVAAKIANSRVVLRRNGILADTLSPFDDMAERAATEQGIDALRGLEGTAAGLFFTHFGRLAAPFPFEGRVYHPPEGPVNAMLSFGYSLLYNRLGAALAAQGFDPRLGVYHVGRGRHMALASDLMEPLRHVIERIVLALIHRKEIRPEHFSTSERYGKALTRLDGDGFRLFVAAFESTMGTSFKPARSVKALSMNAYLDAMILSFGRHLAYGLPFTPLRIT